MSVTIKGKTEGKSLFLSYLRVSYIYMTWGQILLKVFKYKYKYFLKYLNTNTNTYFSVYLNTNTFGKYLNTNTNTLYKLNMIKQCMLIME